MVEQVDRDAAAKVLRTFIQDPAYADMIERGEADFDPNVRLFEAYRIAAEQRGREQERAAIVAWLRSLDRESGDINRFLPTTLANWIDERMHEL